MKRAESVSCVAVEAKHSEGLRDMKRILMVTYSLDFGGLERVVVNLANALDPRLYQAYVCCIAHGGSLAASLARSDMLFVLGNEGRINYRSCRDLYRIMRRLSIDVVHTHNTAGLLYSFAPAKLCRTPIIHTNHGYVFTEREHRAVEFLEALLSRHVDRYVCVSEHLKTHVAHVYRLRAAAIAVIYNGITVPDPRASVSARDGRGIVIGSVGNLRAIKNYQLLISAFAEIARRYPGCRLELVGEGEEHDRLVNLCATLGIERDVHFVGHAADPYVYLKQFDIFVLPSLSEGISMSILEALALKRICLASDVGGNPEIIRDGANGFLFKSNDAEQLVLKLEELIRNLHDPSLDRVREMGRATVEQRFSLDAMVSSYGALYDAVVPA